MKTRILDAKSSEAIREAGRLLFRGELVAFPTETVYGLGARADDADAVDRLYSVKERPRDKKCAILIADAADAGRYAAGLSVRERRLAEKFWPGPLTLVTQSGKGDSVGLRCPDCESTRSMLRAAGSPIYAPSANPAGREPAKTRAEVLEYFEAEISAVLDGGRVEGGVPSTVVRLEKSEPVILRPGALSEAEIRSAIEE